MYYHITTYGWDIGWRLLLPDNVVSAIAIVVLVAALLLPLVITGSSSTTPRCKSSKVRRNKLENGKTMDELMQEAMEEDSITCQECGEVLEVDAKTCDCGWVNPLVESGLVRIE